MKNKITDNEVQKRKREISVQARKAEQKDIASVRRRIVDGIASGDLVEPFDLAERYGIEVPRSYVMKVASNAESRGNYKMARRAYFILGDKRKASSFDSLIREEEDRQWHSDVCRAMGIN